MSKSSCGGIAGLERGQKTDRDGASELPAAIAIAITTTPDNSRAGRCASTALGTGFGLAPFQDLFADFLGGRLDFLHLLAHARSGGLVAAFGLADIFKGLVHQPLERLVFLHKTSVRVR